MDSTPKQAEEQRTYLQHYPCYHMLLRDLRSSFTEKYSQQKLNAGAAAVVSYNNQYHFVIDPSKYWSVSTKHDREYYELTFGCPGGSVEEGESFTDTLHREIQEELQTDLEIINPRQSYYIDLDGTKTEIAVEDPIQPLVVYEHQYADPSKGASKALIAVFLGNAREQPRPSAEIPALFATSAERFSDLADGLSLQEFYNTFAIKSQQSLPNYGTIRPSQSPSVLFNNFIPEFWE